MWLRQVYTHLGEPRWKILRMGFTPDPHDWQYWTGSKWGGVVDAKLYDDEDKAWASIEKHKKSNPTDQYFMRFYTSRKEE